MALVQVVGVTCPTCGPHEGKDGDDLGWFQENANEERFHDYEFRMFAYYCLRCDPGSWDVGPTRVEDRDLALEQWRLVIAVEPILGGQHGRSPAHALRR